MKDYKQNTSDEIIIYFVELFKLVLKSCRIKNIDKYKNCLINQSKRRKHQTINVETGETEFQEPDDPNGNPYKDDYDSYDDDDGDDSLLDQDGKLYN